MKFRCLAQFQKVQCKPRMKPVITLISVIFLSAFGALESRKITGNRKELEKEVRHLPEKNELSFSPDLVANITERLISVGRTFLEPYITGDEKGQSRTFDKMKDSMGNFTKFMHHMDPLFHKDFFSKDKDKDKNSTCGDVSMMHPFPPEIFIPIAVIVPGIIIGILLLIKAIGIGTAWIPSITAPLFKGLMGIGQHFKGGNDNADSGGYGYGWSPSSGYGPPPSHSYGAPNLSRQTTILDAIENLSNIYGQMQGQAQPSDGMLNGQAQALQANSNSNYPNNNVQYSQPQPQAQINQNQQGSNLGSLSRDSLQMPSLTGSGNNDNGFSPYYYQNAVYPNMKLGEGGNSGIGEISKSAKDIAIPDN